ncbi:MAG: hypothetical protein FWC43_14795 [Planctomycetaceae bacterium]|nr:hypothetical protein [Planctomycetaceae bacterium]
MKRDLAASLGLHWTEPVAETSSAYDNGWSRRPNNDTLKQYTCHNNIFIRDREDKTWGYVTTYRKATEEQFHNRDKISPETLPIDEITAVIFMESEKAGAIRNFERFRAKSIASAKRRMEQYLARLFPELEQWEGETELTASLRRLHAVFSPKKPNPYKYGNTPKPVKNT